MTALRRRVLLAIAALFVAAVWVISVKPTMVATARVTTVADYLVRIARAMGLEGRVGPRAPVDEYLPLLVQQGVITADAARTLRTDQPLTHDFAFEVSSRISDPPAPTFLSKTYVVTAFLADNGIGLGLVRDDDSNPEDQVENFNARAHEREHHCPTPRHRHSDNDDRCPEEP